MLNFTTPSGNFSDPLNLTLTGAVTGQIVTRHWPAFRACHHRSRFPASPCPNFEFVSTGTGGNFSGGTGTWTITRGTESGNTPTLTLEADVTATPAGVPEPGSLALLGMRSPEWALCAAASGSDNAIVPGPFG